MAERRSSRSRSTVKYSGFDDESDDDFADVSKKRKTDDTAKSKKSAKDKNWCVDADSTLTKSHNSNKIRRAPLSEKIYKRELKEALELSLVETEGSQDVLCQNKDSSKPQLPDSEPGYWINQQKPLPEFINSEADLHPQASPQDSTTKVVPHLGYIGVSTIIVDDSIESIEEMDSSSGTTKRQGRQDRTSVRQASKKPQVVDADTSEDESDFSSSADSDEDENSNTSSSEYMSEDDRTSKTKKIKHANPKQKEEVTTKALKSVSSGASKPASKQPARARPKASSSTTISTSSQSASEHFATKPPSNVRTACQISAKSATTSPLMSNHHCQNIPSILVSPWKPPSLAGRNDASSSTFRSPSSGLRLGLSRNQRVKPLHPSVHV